MDESIDLICWRKSDRIAHPSTYNLVLGILIDALVFKNNFIGIIYTATLYFYLKVYFMRANNLKLYGCTNCIMSPCISI